MDRRVRASCRSGVGVKRGKRLLRKSPLRARVRLKAKRATPRRAKNRCPAFLYWLRTKPCCVPPVWEAIAHPSEAAHVHARRNGGDVANAVPLCPTHHAEQHRMGIKSFAAKYALDLDALARRYWEAYVEELIAKAGAFRQEVGHE
jgi:putative HNHc nuclease